MSNKKLNIINWKNILKHSENFQKNNPKWAFIEDVFDSSFYDELCSRLVREATPQR